VSAGLHSGYRQVGTGTYVESAQVEAVVTSEASLVLMSEADLSRATPDIYRAAVVARLFPIETFLIELGAGTQHVAGASAGEGFKPTFALDWQLPFDARTWQASLFVEQQLEELKIAGVRISWDMGPTLQDLVRRQGWRRVR
jgi:hypothetical protein